MRLFAPAKVNLYLRVTGRREDGYHLLDTLMAPISLGDEVEVSRADGPPGSMTVRADDPDVPRGPENTVRRAAWAFRERTGLRDPVAVDLRKRIPVGAGLGGGSTDAAAALRGMNDLLGAGLSDRDLLALAVSVGADVPFFVRGGAARAGGIGEKLSPAGPLPRLWMVVLFPNFPVSTAWVYRNYPLKLTKSSDDNNLTGKLGTPREVARVMVNDLETVTIGRYPAHCASEEPPGRKGRRRQPHVRKRFRGFWPVRRRSGRQDGVRRAGGRKGRSCASGFLADVRAHAIAGRDGRSPSGKAPDFGSGTRRFESFPPSQPLSPDGPVSGTPPALPLQRRR